MIQQARGPTACARVHERAHLRFSVIGQLLAAPPAKGELKAAITALAPRAWQHPTTGDPVQFGFATIERWYYRALKERADPDSPYQNAKQEAFWGPVKGRLIAMLEHVPDLTLNFLNEATQAWVEHKYNRKPHAEIGEAPITRFLAGSRGDAAVSR
jgi:transposase InsO family protein